MSRSISAGMITELTADTVELYQALELLFDDADGTRYDQAGYAGDRAVRLWTGFGDRTIDGNTFQGAGYLMRIDLPSEVSDLSAQGASIGFSGLVTDILSLALSEPYVGRKGRVFQCTANYEVEIFAGLMNVMSPTDNATSADINLTLEGMNVTLQKPNVRRYTSASHKMRHPTDTFFDSVASLQDKDVPWGRVIDN